MPNYVNIAWEKHRQSVGRYYGFTYIYKAMGCKRLLFFEKPILQVVHREKKAQNLKKRIDYYPFGMAMPSRNLEGDYRYAYQGQEKDPETGKEAFELRLWDSRIGRWLTIDPAGQYSSPYLGMGNNPITQIDPDGAWHYDSDGHLVSDPGDTAESLSKFKGINQAEASELISAEGFLTDYNSGSGNGLFGDQVSFNRQYGSPYRVNTPLTGGGIDTSGSFNGWNNFSNKANGGAQVIAGDLDYGARVDINNNGEHVLSVWAGAQIADRPSFKNGSQLSIKYASDESLSLATKSFGLELEPLPFLPQNYRYLGHKSIILPDNPNEINRLELIVSIHTIGNYTSSAISSHLNVNLLDFIIYGN